MTRADNASPSGLQKVAKEFFRDQFICQYCGADGLRDVNAYYTLKLDHFVPKSAGGPDSPENLVTACHACNAFKGKRRFPTLDKAKAYLRQRRFEAERELSLVKKYMEESKA